MIEFLIGLSISSMWITLGGIGFLFLLRIVAAVLHRADLKTALTVILTPFSVGYFRTWPERTILKIVYRTATTIVFAFSLLALFWVLYTHFS